MCYDTLQMLEIIASAVQDRSMLVAEAKEAPNLAVLVEGAPLLQKAMVKAVQSVEKTLKTLSSEHRAALLKLSAILPGSFDKGTLQKLLDMSGVGGRGCEMRDAHHITSTLPHFHPGARAPAAT